MDLKVVVPLSSQKGFSNVHAQAQSPPVYLEVHGKAPSGEFVRLRKGTLNPGEGFDEADFPVNMLIDAGKVFVFKELLVKSTATVTLTPEELE